MLTTSASANRRDEALGNDVVAAYLAERLAGYGYTVELDAFNAHGHACADENANANSHRNAHGHACANGNANANASQPALEFFVAIALIIAFPGLATFLPSLVNQ
mgnify:CR=1 FL=1